MVGVGLLEIYGNGISVVFVNYHRIVGMLDASGIEVMPKIGVCRETIVWSWWVGSLQWHVVEMGIGALYRCGIAHKYTCGCIPYTRCYMFYACKYARSYLGCICLLFLSVNAPGQPT